MVRVVTVGWFFTLVYFVNAFDFGNLFDRTSGNQNGENDINGGGSSTTSDTAQKISDFTSDLLDTAPMSIGGEEADVYAVFIMDESASVGTDGFHQAKCAMKNYIQMLTADRRYNYKVGFISYSDRINVEFDFDTYKRASQMIRHVDRMRFRSGRKTCTDKALDKARSMLHRKVGPKAIFVMTDGKSNCGGNTCNAARSLRRAGASIYCQGVGSGVDRSEVKCIATGKNYSFDADFDRACRASEEAFALYSASISK